MSSNDRLRTHKLKRNKAKKRKLEAFLNLVRQDESGTLPKKKKSPSTFEENYKALKDELRKYQNKKSPDPLFCLKDDGRHSLVNFATDGKKSNCIEPLFIEDIQHLILTSVLGNLSPYPLCWARLENARNVAKTVFLEIGGLPQSDIGKLQSKFIENQSVFPFVIEILSSNIPFASELSTSHLLTDAYNQEKESCSSMFPIDKKNDKEAKASNFQNNVSRLHLLLSPIQLAMEHYPLPLNVFEQSKSEGYCFSRESYTPVSENSPMFAIDCEMCRTVSGRQEVTRIAIVNENLETVYHTLVKPEEEIIDYITRFSGITEKMLLNVTTTLKDVQNDMRRILPSDAILCGQSLNCDLHGLKMIHPYVIDTSVIYNEFGVRHKKTSLKKLAQIHLKEKIQDGKKGHNPIEDSIATMKLVQLKLKNFIEYGDAVLSENSENNESSNKVDANNIPSTVEKSSKYPVKLNLDTVDNGFFSIISKFSKKICLIGSENYLSNYPEVVKTNASLVTKSKLKKIIKATTDSVPSHDLILSHLMLHQEDYSFADLADEIKQLHNNLPEKTVFIVFMPCAINTTEEKFRKNYCMITVKTDKSV